MGDAIDLDDLQVLFKDAASALVVLSGDLADPHYVSSRSQMSRAITGALREQRVGHVVLASSIGAERDRGVGMVAGLHELEGLLFGLEDANVLSLRAALQGIGMSDEVASLLVELQIAINENQLIDEVQRTSESTTPTRLEEFLSSALTR